MKLIKFILLFLFSIIFLNMPTSSQEIFCEDIVVNYRVQRAWDEMGNTKQFQLALDRIDELLYENNDCIGYFNLIKSVVKIHTENFKKEPENLFPIIPIYKFPFLESMDHLSKKTYYSNHKIYLSPERIAIDDSMQEIKGVLEKLVVGNGQIPILIISSQKSTERSYSDYVFKSLEGEFSFAPIPKEQIFSVLGEYKSLSLSNQKDLLVFINNFLEKENWNSLILIDIIDNFENIYSIENSLNKLNFPNPINESFLTINVYRYDNRGNKGESNSLKLIINSDVTGVQTLSYQIKAFTYSVYLFIFIILIFGFIFRSQILKNNTIIIKIIIIYLLSLLITQLVLSFYISISESFIYYYRELLILYFIITFIIYLITYMIFLTGILSKFIDSSSLLGNPFYFPILLFSIFLSFSILLSYHSIYFTLVNNQSEINIFRIALNCILGTSSGGIFGFLIHKSLTGKLNINKNTFLIAILPIFSMVFVFLNFITYFSYVKYSEILSIIFLGFVSYNILIKKESKLIQRNFTTKGSHLNEKNELILKLTEEILNKNGIDNEIDKIRESLILYFRKPKRSGKKLIFKVILNKLKNNKKLYELDFKNDTYNEKDEFSLWLNLKIPEMYNLKSSIDIFDRLDLFLNNKLHEHLKNIQILDKILNFVFYIKIPTVEERCKNISSIIQKELNRNDIILYITDFEKASSITHMILNNILQKYNKKNFFFAIHENENRKYIPLGEKLKVNEPDIHILDNKDFLRINILEMKELISKYDLKFPENNNHEFYMFAKKYHKEDQLNLNDYIKEINKKTKFDKNLSYSKINIFEDINEPKIRQFLNLASLFGYYINIKILKEILGLDEYNLIEIISYTTRYQIVKIEEYESYSSKILKWNSVKYIKPTNYKKDLICITFIDPEYKEYIRSRIMQDLNLLNFYKKIIFNYIEAQEDKFYICRESASLIDLFFFNQPDFTNFSFLLKLLWFAYFEGEVKEFIIYKIIIEKLLKENLNETKKYINQDEDLFFAIMNLYHSDNFEEGIHKNDYIKEKLNSSDIYIELKKKLKEYIEKKECLFPEKLKESFQNIQLNSKDLNILEINYQKIKEIKIDEENYYENRVYKYLISRLINTKIKQLRDSHQIKEAYKESFNLRVELNDLSGIIINLRSKIIALLKIKKTNQLKQTELNELDIEFKEIEKINFFIYETQNKKSPFVLLKSEYDRFKKDITNIY